MSEKRTIRAPRGNELSCKGWHQEAALRMLMNNLDPEVAEDPDNLIVYGGTGRAARSWEAFDAIVRSLRELENDETLLVQSGKPVGIFRTHDQAPRVLIANSNLVGQWSNYPEFNRLEKLGLTMYGQMTAGSWIYIASQGIVQGTFETFSAAGERHFDGSLEGKLLVTGGLGGMGGAQPLAATMAGALCLGIEVDPRRIEKRLQSGYCDNIAFSLDEAMQVLDAARAKKKAVSVGLVGNCADILPEMVGWRSPMNTLIGRWPRWRSMLTRCSRSRKKARSLLIMGTTFALRRKKPAARRRLIFQALFLNTSGRYFVKGRGHSVGSR